MKEYKYTINGNKYEVAVGDIVDNIVTLTVNGEEFKVEIEREPEKKKAVVRPVATAATDATPVADSGAAVNKANALKSPLPGVITDIMVNVGDEVTAGQNIIVLEAMKMANNLQAEKSGTVTALCVQVGQSVMEDEPLIVIE